MSLFLIAAQSENRVIGNGSVIPWRVKGEQRLFRLITDGHTLIMGRKTFESVGHPLPHRLNVVVTRQKDYKADNVHVFHSIEEAVEFCKTKSTEYGDEIFIIGGGNIYEQSMNLVDRIYLTRIHQDFAGDVYYPEISEKEFRQVECRDRTEPLAFSFLIYDRKK